MQTVARVSRDSIPSLSPARPLLFLPARALSHAVPLLACRCFALLYTLPVPRRPDRHVYPVGLWNELTAHCPTDSEAHFGPPAVRHRAVHCAVARRECEQ